MSGSTFKVNTGLLFTALGGPATTPPPNELDLTVLYAKTAPLGTPITPSAWQQDADPIFIWEPPATGLELAGYSFEVDADPDETVDTTATSWDVSQDELERLADGQRTFSVRAIASSGISGAPLAFPIWIDTTAPTISTYTPQPGSLLNTLAPVLTANLFDAHSGIEPSGITLLVNQTPISVSFDGASGEMTASGQGAVEEGANIVTLTVADQVGNEQAPLVWSFTADVTPPSGSVLINAGASTTTSVYVTLNLTGTDALSGVTQLLLSNDPLTGYVQEPFTTAREVWKLNPETGTQRFYVKFVDGAGNTSEAVTDDIELLLLAPDTIILSGPAGLTPEPTAQFTFQCSEGDCFFSYAFDNEEWSEWSPETSASHTNLMFGNHYFRVKAASESNGQPGIQLDEEDPTPAERTWIVGVEPPSLISPYGPPIKLWRIE